MPGQSDARERDSKMRDVTPLLGASEADRDRERRADQRGHDRVDVAASRAQRAPRAGAVLRNFPPAELRPTLGASS
jgi:hypothetical protein